ncbi:MAG TPA: DUF302 domain-containing protein, partial [Longimicrobiales bacterium]
MIETSYAMLKRSALAFEEADRQVRAELQKEGFGVLTEIDVAATLKKKINLDMPRYLILGACAPQLAGQALQQEPDVGLLLPCNVVVREDSEGVVVEALDPVRQLALSGNRALEPLAGEARERLQRAL